jgi:hypothetical protein
MNPQIQEILNKSTDDIMGVAVVDQARFARLLVEECARICDELKFVKEGPSHEVAYQRALCSQAIMENFGLKSKGPITAINVK